jgi:putative phage-type endonuclease
VQQSAEWFQARRDKITASAAAGLLSLSPFTTRQAAFERLVLNTRSAPSAAMQRGIDEEGQIADMYVRIFPQAALQPTGLWSHPEHTWLVSSPDRLLGEEGLLEVKRFSRLAKPGPNVLIQVLIQLECTGRRFCDIIQYDGTHVRVDRVERDRELQEDLVDLLHPMHEAANAARASGSHVAPPLNMRDWEELKAGLRGLYVQRLV